MIQPIPKVAKLLTKVKRIQSDILFDKDEASIRWDSLRDEIVRKSVERRKYELDRSVKIESAAAGVSSSRGAPSLLGGEDEEDLDMMGTFFSSLPEITSDSEFGTSRLTIGEKTGQTMMVRDFGNWAGMNPRRVLEEACKARLDFHRFQRFQSAHTIARDPSCKIAYKVVSESTFSYRHSLRIDWSISQDLSWLIHDPSINCDATEFYVKFQMITVSTPDVLQSESYISTVALYLIFGHSPKEEKAYLRLPPQWRDLWMEMLLFKKKHNDAADRGALRQLREMIRATKSEAHALPMSARDITEMQHSREKPRTSSEAGTRACAAGGLTNELVKLWSSKSSSSAYRGMLRSREQLPIWSFRHQILRKIEENQVVIVCGETGCGKSTQVCKLRFRSCQKSSSEATNHTQVPAFILEHNLSKNRSCKIYCTEPRRISAISLARRVSEELGEQRIDFGTSRSLVGYAIRLESKLTDETRLVYATTGIVMRMLERSDDLGEITHLILDEVHERSLDNDFLLIVLRRLLLRRPALKVILMSATVDAERFSSYLSGAPIMTVPGRTFPVETKYLEDVIEITNFDHGEESTRSYQELEYSDVENKPNNKIDGNMSEYLKGYSAKTQKTLAKLDEYRIDYGLIVKLLEVITSKKEYVSFSKAILVFLPGIAEIRRLSNLIQSHSAFSQGWNICALHSTIATEEQELAFLGPPPGTRKIVLATNIAETGITIPDITCIIDSGKHKEMRFVTYSKSETLLYLTGL